MFRINYVETKTSPNNVSLLDSDNLHGLLDSDDFRGCEIKKSQIYADQLKDLISFDDISTEDVLKQGHGNQESSDVLFDNHGNLDEIIQANIKGFGGGAAEGKTLSIGSIIDGSSLVKRRK
ncbi:hypothetical protein ACOSQ2_018611 [Xanthoceras sorbifolium]